MPEEKKVVVAQSAGKRPKGPLDGLKVDLKVGEALRKLLPNLNQKRVKIQEFIQLRPFYQLAIGLLVIVAIASAVAGYDAANYTLPVWIRMTFDGLKNISPLLMIALCVVSEDKERKLSDLGWVALALAIPQVCYWAIWMACMMDLVTALAQRGWMIGAATVQSISMGWMVILSGLALSGTMLKVTRKA